MSIKAIGVSYTFNIGLISQSSRPQLKVNPTIAAGDFKVSTDGSAFTNLSTLPDVYPSGGRSVRIQLSTSEMNGQNVVIVASDVAGAEWDDLLINIETEPAERSSNLVKIDGLATSGNNATLNLKKLNIVNSDFGGYGIEVSTTSSGGSGGPIRIVGTGGGNIGVGITAPFGVRIESTSISTPSIDLVSATAGYGLGGVIQGTLKDLSVVSVPELTSPPTASSTLKEKIAWLFLLSRNKITQTATTQSVRNDSDTANISTSSLSDDNTTSTRGKFVP
jgi:hypothetical protein